MNDFTKEELHLINKEAQKQCFHEHVTRIYYPNTQEPWKYKCNLCELYFYPDGKSNE